MEARPATTGGGASGADPGATPSGATALKPSAAAIAAFYAHDPSYVFFRTLPNYEGGPVGALGVPLTPQRSVAVADFFWGFGAEAARRAGQMKQAGQMWILLPKGQMVNGLSDSIATRGIGGAPQPSDAECVVPDADFCVE